MKKIVSCMAVLALLVSEILCLGSIALSENSKHVVTLVEGSYFDYTNDDLTQGAIKLFESQYPDYSVHIRSYAGQDWKTQMVTSLLADESGNDILPLTSDMYDNYLDHDLLLNLSAQDGFDDIENDWIDIASLFSKNGILYSVPFVIWPSPYVWNDALARKIGLAAPSKYWTWSDALDLGREMKRLKGNTSVYLFAGSSELAPYIYIQYLSTYWTEMRDGSMSFDSDEFRNLLTIWKQMWDEGMIQDYDYRIGSDASTILVVDGDEMQNQQHNAFMPKLNRDRCYPMTVLSFGVNARSLQREKAAEFLRIFTSKRTIIDNNPRLGFHLKDISFLDSIPEGEVQESKEEIDYYRQLIERGVHNIYSDELYTFAEKLFPEYLKGDISEDELISLLNQSLDLMLNE